MHPPSFRDVGEMLSLWMAPSPILPGRLIRGGRFDTLTTREDLGSPRTILCLRRGADPDHLGVRIVHHPAPDDLENYDTTLRRVADWVYGALEVLAAPTTELPVYVHCTAGRDRTGVVIGAALAAAGIPGEIVIEEYLLSDGARRDRMVVALAGIRTPRFLDSTTAAAIRRRFRT